jgi:predicted kinase
MRTLILVRGLPGAGKSTFAKTLGGIHIEADHYFMKDGEYKFDASKLKQAHEYCRTSTEGWMMEGYVLGNIVVSNTFTREWEMDAYYELAEKYGYRVHSVVVENRHNGMNEHSVPADILEAMKNRFEIKL